MGEKWGFAGERGTGVGTGFGELLGCAVHAVEGGEVFSEVEFGV